MTYTFPRIYNIMYNSVLNLYFEFVKDIVDYLEISDNDHSHD